ncbi:MAG: hypothetical protein IJA88_00990 [Clostridia bacterium]|nr:hypothetical protein [Clostridia bacterium]
MDFIWAGQRDKYNSRIIFTIENLKDADKMILCAADFYQVFVDGKLLSYGPERTVAGYAKTREFSIKAKAKIEIYVSGYNFNCYACDFQLPYFSAELVKDGKIVYTSKDFKCFEDLGRLTEVSRFTGQRACIECYDFTKSKLLELETYSVETPKILKGSADSADYNVLDFKKLSEKDFFGFDEVKTPEWCTREKYRLHHVSQFDIEKDFLSKLKEGYFATDFTLQEEHSGFICLEITATEKTEVFVTFEEILADGKWTFRRSGCNELISLIINKGRTEYISTEPYALMLLKVISKAKVSVKASLITLENKNINGLSVFGNEKFIKVIESAKSTFRQNAVDIYTDCPGRERAGWLCDSLFLAQAERLFTGKNDIEKRFLENFMLAITPEVPDKMIPKCMPSEHPVGHYLPTFAMWFLVQIYDYYMRTSDMNIVLGVKEKSYNVIEFLDKFINSDGLLENLEGWVFIEWSACNKVEYVSGVNYPANMLYAYALRLTGELYNDEQLILRSKKMQEKVVEQSYNGEFFVDNAIRVDGKLVRQETHLTETCQYYALFTGLCPDQTFKEKMIKDFGPLRKDAFSHVERSNMIVGNCLRFLWLLNQGENERVINESVEHFYKMAKVTGTLWENNLPTASCNHGYASVAAVFLVGGLLGYKTVKDGKPVLDGPDLTEKYGVKVKFNYKEN